MTKTLPMLLVLALLAQGVAAQDSFQQGDIEQLDLSYIYAALLGTGTYKIDGRRLTMLSLPLSYTQWEAGADHAYGLSWEMPLVVGYDSVGDNNIVGKVLDDDLVTLAALPGVEITIPMSDNWTLKPFGNLGYGHDFVTDENIFMGIAGVRALALRPLESGWDLRLGGSARLAAEYQFRSERNVVLGLFEAGVDLRRNTRLQVLETPINAGAYYILQWFYPEWSIGDGLPGTTELSHIHEFGLSVGLAKPRQLLGFTVARLRLGYKTGPNFKGWTIGTEFPF